MWCIHIYVPSRKKICCTLIIVLPYTLTILRQEAMGLLIINSDITNSILTVSNSSWVNEMKEIRKPSCCKWGKLVKQCKERGNLANSQVSLDNVLSHWHNRTIYLNPAASICYTTDFSYFPSEKSDFTSIQQVAALLATIPAQLWLAEFVWWICRGRNACLHYRRL